MKRLGMLLMACAIVLGMSQCKKEETPSVNNNEKIHITFTASSGQGDAKTGFTPSGNSGNGHFVWSNDVEYINVGGSSSGYLGRLSGNGQNTDDTETYRVFSGDITAPDPGETLYFFYLGNGDHAGAKSINFADQSGDLDRVTNKHIAIGRDHYDGNETSFSATLEMAMSIACFNTSAFIDGSNNPETVYLYGDDIYSSATIDYTTGKITGSTKSYICAGEANAACYVALIPDDDDTDNLGSTQINFFSKSHHGSIYFNGTLGAGQYYAHQGGEPGLEVEAEVNNLEPVDAPYVFSVSASTTVQFSPGNLQATTTDFGAHWTWAFAADQWAYVGNNVANNKISGNGTVSENGTVDMFGWSTAATVFGIHNSRMSSSYSGGFADWGINAINNPKTGNTDPAGTWRTLSTEEWQYLFNSRSGDYRWLKACITVGENTYKGVILFPDGYNGSIGSYTYQNFTDKWIDVSADDWSAMEAVGAVFLPATGYRNGQTAISGVGNYCHYWSSSRKDADYAYSVYISFGSTAATGVMAGNQGREPCRGIGVRLVRNAY